MTPVCYHVTPNLASELNGDQAGPATPDRRVSIISEG